MYDEEVNAERCVRAIAAALALTQPPGHLFVVNDGSRDRTAEVLDRTGRDVPNLTIVNHPGNRGYGAALRTGAAAAAEKGFGYVLYMDSDLTTDPKYLPAFVELMRADVDVIKATRYAGGGGMAGVPAYRALISRVGNAISRPLVRLPLTDLTNGFRAIKTDLLVSLQLQERSFSIIMEELYRLSLIARTYGEVPYVLTSRGPAEGASRFMYRPKVFLQYLKYALLSALHAPFRRRTSIRRTR
jgi:glycosyltransferase involved in cell wall biosynthesis